MRFFAPPAALLLLTLLLLPSSFAQDSKEPGEPRIVDFEIVNDNLQVKVSFRLVGAFDDVLKRRIESGVPTSLLYRVQLLRDRKRWFDKRVFSSTLQVIAMYNAITREYLINYKHDGDLIDSRLVRDPKELEAAMTEFESFPALTLDPESTDQRLLGRVRAELGTSTIFFFIPTTVTTPWADKPLTLAL